MTDLLRSGSIQNARAGFPDTGERNGIQLNSAVGSAIWEVPVKRVCTSANNAAANLILT
ncbi:hypothetical protein P4C99_03900 [Pontiellaceae bacterium B1224]|nr:hypothetical protein [Pontiellaceae bacterium B1224]